MAALSSSAAASARLSPARCHENAAMQLSTVLRSPALIILAAFAFSTSVAVAKDLAVLKKLPQRLMALKKKAEKASGGGSTPELRAAAWQYNDDVAAIIRELGKTYYAANPLKPEDVEEYVKAEYAVRVFKQKANNPSGEFLGTIAPIELASEVGTALEETIAEMVEAIVGEDEAFDLKKWSEAWKKATSAE
jgi:hypothetical protein